MSKNYELLQRVARDDFFNAPVVPTPVPQEAHTAFPFKKTSPDNEITKLVQRLFPHTGNGNGPKVVSFTGFIREDRSSWICARSAQALAMRAEGSVCLVETNFGSPQLHIHAGTNNLVGLAEALTTNGPVRSFVLPLSGENLWLMPSGLVKPGFYPSMDRYRERFAELREAFDFVLVSAPPISRETDAIFIGQLADGVVLIVDANQTRRETVRRAKEQLERAQVTLLGAVLDQRTFPIPEMLYRRL